MFKMLLCALLLSGASAQGLSHEPDFDDNAILCDGVRYLMDDYELDGIFEAWDDYRISDDETCELAKVYSSSFQKDKAVSDEE